MRRGKPPGHHHRNPQAPGHGHDAPATRREFCSLRFHPAWTEILAVWRMTSGGWMWYDGKNRSLPIRVSFPEGKRRQAEKEDGYEKT